MKKVWRKRGGNFPGKKKKVKWQEEFDFYYFIFTGEKEFCNKKKLFLKKGNNKTKKKLELKEWKESKEKWKKWWWWEEG